MSISLCRAISSAVRCCSPLRAFSSVSGRDFAPFGCFFFADTLFSHHDSKCATQSPSLSQSFSFNPARRKKASISSSQSESSISNSFFRISFESKQISLARVSERELFLLLLLFLTLLLIKVLAAVLVAVLAAVLVAVLSISSNSLIFITCICVNGCVNMRVRFCVSVCVTCVTSIRLSCCKTLSAVRTFCTDNPSSAANARNECV